MKTQAVLAKVGITPDQILTSIDYSRILIMESDGICRIDRVPKIFYDQFALLEDGYTNPILQFGKYCKMEIVGWGRFDGKDVQMYNLDDGTWSFCAEKGSMLDRYLKELFKDEED